MNEDKTLLTNSARLCQVVEKGMICFNKLETKTLCRKHNKRFKKYGSVNLQIKVKKHCVFIDCENKYEAKGYCNKHYQKYVKNKNKKLANKKSLGNNGNGFKKGNTYAQKTSRLRKYNEQCIVKACENTIEKGVIRKGLCSKHYTRWRRHGDYNVVLVARAIKNNIKK